MLCRAFGVRGRAPLVWVVLNSPRLPLFLFESFRHRALMRALKQPRWAVASGYTYIRRGERPHDLDESELLHVDGGR